MDTNPKVVLVASGSSHDRAIVLERLLAAAAERSGWSGRLEIRLGGVDAGAGRLSDEGRKALAAVGLDASDVVCPDLERRPSLLDGAAFVVCDRGDVADILVDWNEAGTAEFICVDELEVADGRDPAPPDDDHDPSIEDEAHRFEARIDEVLRRIVRVPAA